MDISMAFTISAPRSRREGSDQRQRHAIERTVQTVQRLVDQFDTSSLEQISSEIEAALNVLTTKPTQPSIIAALVGDREYSEQERRLIEITARLRSFEQRRELLKDAYTASQVATLLHTSRQTPHDRFRRGTLLAILDRGALRFPDWQFDADGLDGVVHGLPQVLQALKVSPLAKISWFVRPNPYLDDRTPLDVLKLGEIERVVRVAEAVGVH